MKSEADIEVDCPNNNCSVSSSICLQQSCLEISYITTSKELHAKHFVTNNIKTVHTENTESQTAASHYGFTDRAVIKNIITCVKEKLIFAAHADCDGRAKLPPESTAMVKLQNPLTSVDSTRSDIIRFAT